MTVEDLKKLLSDKFAEQIATYIQAENPLPKGIVDWLAQLVLLQGVPFNHLVADEKMLPNESIRFFYLDQNWTDALLDGALSVGIHSGRDELLQQAMNAVIRRETDKIVPFLRERSQGKTTENLPQMTQIGTVSGLIIRSAVVSNYPGLEVRAYEDIDREEVLDTLRLERLAPNVLLAMFDSVPAVIEIKAPSESTNLGIIKTENKAFVHLRHITGKGALGQILDKNNQFELEKQHYRNEEKRVLNVTRLRNDMAKQIGVNALKPAAFGLQLMQNPKTFQLFNESIAPTLSRSVEPAVRLDKSMLFKQFMQE